MRIDLNTRDRLAAIGSTLRKGFALPERTSDRQFQALIHQLARYGRARGDN
jgi:hypothetical protein